MTPSETAEFFFEIRRKHRHYARSLVAAVYDRRHINLK
jgi:hypothetical protein